MANQLIIIFLLFFFLFQKLCKGDILRFLAVAIALWVGFYFSDQFITYSVSGFYSLMIANLFLSNEEDYVKRTASWSKKCGQRHQRP
jgi:hypothetical protein